MLYSLIRSCPDLFKWEEKCKFFSSFLFFFPPDRVATMELIMADTQCESYHSMVPLHSGRANTAGSRLGIKQTHLSHGESHMERMCFYFKTCKKKCELQQKKAKTMRYHFLLLMSIHTKNITAFFKKNELQQAIYHLPGQSF